MNEDTGVVRLQMEVWHPGCWTLELTEEVGAGLLGGMHQEMDNRTICRDTVYGDTTVEVEELIDEARALPDVDAVFELNHGYRSGSNVSVPGNATRELLVEKRSSANYISGAFLSRGFVLAEPINMYDGIERWTVLTTLDREGIRSTLDEIREREDAEIKVKQLTRATDAAGQGALPLDSLSVRQREVFDLARERGYYAWPKETTPRELAAEIGITTSTFHEHLHKAEAKLLNPLRERT